MTINFRSVTKTLPISAARSRLCELVANAEQRNDEVVITRNGKPTVVIVNYAQYHGLKETLDVLADENLMRQIRASERYLARGGKGIPFERLFAKPVNSRSKRVR
jgi:antitoxin YefM